MTTALSTAPPSDLDYTGTTDPVWPGIQRIAGSELIYRAASGLERAMADVDASRLISTYAELIKDQWDADAISYRNLPFLAWASGVNLWEEDWDETSRRHWVKNQWLYQSQRGSLLGISNFVKAVGGEVVHAIVPPASFYPGPALTTEQRAAYVARFPQLRLYPYAPRPAEKWLCYMGRFIDPATNEKKFNRNGCFFPFYPTNYDAGGKYEQNAVLWDHGVETQLTARTWTSIDTGTNVATKYTTVTLPGHIDSHWYTGQKGKYFLPAGHPVSQNRHGIFLGALDATNDRLVRVPKNVPLDLFQAKGILQTVIPGMQPLNVTPEYVFTKHPIRKAEFYCGQCLTKKFQPQSNAWQYLYSRWYLFDPKRVPDNKKASVFMGQARFGIHKYTAELKIKAFGKWPRFYLRAGGFMHGFMPPANNKTIEKIRRAVTASMALRDTIRIDTAVMRVVQISDAVLADGKHFVGEFIQD